MINAAPVVMWGLLALKMFLLSFSFSVDKTFSSKSVSYRQGMDGASCLIQSASQCHFMGAFRLFTWEVIIERQVFIDITFHVKTLLL